MFPEGRIVDFVILGIVALIVVGPKDLPILMRKVGKFVGHMRGLAAEFRASFDEMARQSELDDLRKEVEALRSGQPLKSAVGLGDDTEVQGVFDDIHTSLRDDGLQPNPVMMQPIAAPVEAAGETTANSTEAPMELVRADPIPLEPGPARVAS